MVTLDKIGRIVQILAGVSVLALTIWFDPTESGYQPTIYLYYFGNRYPRPFETYRLLLYLLPIAGTAITIGIWKLRSWAWAMSMILSVFVLFQMWICWRAGMLSPIFSFQFTAALICCIGLFAAARDHVIGHKDIIAVLIALMAAIPIVYVKSIYFRSISIDYNWPIPAWLELWDHSEFVGAKAVFLWWILYGATIVTMPMTAKLSRYRSGGAK